MAWPHCGCSESLEHHFFRAVVLSSLSLQFERLSVARKSQGKVDAKSWDFEQERFRDMDT